MFEIFITQEVSTNFVGILRSVSTETLTRLSEMVYQLLAANTNRLHKTTVLSFYI